MMHRNSHFISLFTLLAAIGGCKQNSEAQYAEAKRIAAMPITKVDAATTTHSDHAQDRVPVPAEETVAKVGGKGPEHTSECDRLCRLSDPLHCKNARDCRPSCESMASSPICASEIKSLFGCLLRQPAKNWECDEDGVGAIRDPYCGKEQERLTSCFEANTAK
jgi:hypothetical protein